MALIERLKIKYPGSAAWSFGDTPEMANQLADLVARGLKTASCGSLAAFREEEGAPTLGSYSIILNGQHEPVCIIRIVALRVMRFSEVSEEFARKEGEGDLSLSYWRQEHKAFFQRAGCYSEDMEIVAEEYQLIEVL